MTEHEHGEQESLFGGEAYTRAAPSGSEARAASAQAPSAPLQQSRAFEAYVAAPLDEAQADAFETQAEIAFGPSAEDIAAYAGAELLVASAPTELPVRDAGAELEVLERASVVVDDVRRSRAPLAGPTLDDMMSRAWEGLLSGKPSACPVCIDGVVVPSFAGLAHGTCSSCGTTIQ